MCRISNKIIDQGRDNRYLVDKTGERLQYSIRRLGMCSMHLNTNLKGEISHAFEPIKDLLRRGYPRMEVQ